MRPATRSKDERRPGNVEIRNPGLYRKAFRRSMAARMKHLRAKMKEVVDAMKSLYGKVAFCELIIAAFALDMARNAEGWHQGLGVAVVALSLLEAVRYGAKCVQE